MLDLPVPARPRLLFSSLLFLLFPVTWSPAAHAQQPAAAPAACSAPLPAGSSLAGLDPAARLSFVRSTVDQQAARSRAWARGWTIAGSILVIGNFAQAIGAASRQDRVTDIAGGSTSVLIPLPILMRPPRVLVDRRNVDTSAAGGADLCTRVAQDDELLARDARDQASATGFAAHAGAVGFNVATGLVLGLGFKDWKGAASVGGVGIVIAEAQILTRPRGAVRALARYDRGQLASSPASRSWLVAPSANRSRVGARLAMLF